MPHVPLARSEAFEGRSGTGIYGDVITEIDWSVGQVLGALRAEGLAHHTLVVFTSDNGPWLLFEDHGGSAGLLRNGKGTTWEGGMRVPTIFWWPETVEPAVVDGIGTGTDLFSTIISLAGGSLPDDRSIDGVDLSETLEHGAPSARTEMFFYRSGDLYAYRKSRYKLHLITEGAYGIGEDRTEHAEPLLFNLAVDPGEKLNIADRMPNVVQELLRDISRHRQLLTPADPIFDRVN
jgi:arylsulfatase A-like enzyme